MVHLSTVLGFALAIASVLIPGVLSQVVPSCALTCAEQAAGISSCSVTDTDCICNSPAFATAAGQCLSTTCDAADIQSAEAYFLSLCSGATGLPSTPTVSDTSDTSTPTDTSSTPTDTSSVVPTSTASTDTTPLTTSTTATIPGTTPGTTTSPTSTRSPASVVSSTTSTSSTSEPSNHAKHNQPAGILGAGLALALALFA